MREIENGRIKSVFLGREDHGIPTAYITVEFDGSGQAFGGFDLRTGSSMMNFVIGVLDALRVDNWSNLVGTYVRVRRRDGMIEAIGHVVNDRWYSRDDIYK